MKMWRMMNDKTKKGKNCVSWVYEKKGEERRKRSSNIIEQDLGLFVADDIPLF